ncbi:MAG: chitobiase/beta-hexosaminidase C-terminal domain-containing protein, partial [Bacteroidales bacterium]|nr:chitobiase/beta-hexosaminidase C-terminal domain-containing protein [Bacteroidales bacterium]
MAVLSFITDKGASQLIINEVASSNSDFFRDEDGDYEDWIELMNSGPVSVNLAGYSLSDDRYNLKKWYFPGYELAAGEFLVVFASGKDRAFKPNYWKTIIKEGDSFRYILPGVSTPLNWKDPGFNDAGWLSGPTGIGYGDNDDATIIPKTLSVFLRKQFIIDDPAQVSACIFHMDYDDGFVAYLNGKEIARRSVTGNPPAYDAKASPDREALMYTGGSPERFDIGNPEEYLIQGENVLAIQVHNTSLTSTDLTAIPFFSILTPDLPDEDPPAVLELVSTYFHLNFKLEKSGEPLFLTDPQSSYTDSVLLPSMSGNHSIGRLLSDPERWGVFETPTPGEMNSGPYLQGYVEDVPVFSKTGGRFTDNFQLSLSRAKPDDSIYYTLDGTDPTNFSKLYKTPLTISDNEIVRARILKNGYVPGRIISNTYFKGADNNLPVVCLSTNPSNLWDYNSGIYVKGPNAQNDFPYFGANFWEDWEKPVHIEFYENDGNHAFSLDAGMKIYGGWTRGHPQKSVAFFARSKYGPNRIEYQIFEDKPIMEFGSFIIR